MRASAAVLPRLRVRRRGFRPPDPWIVWCGAWTFIVLSFLFQDVVKLASGRGDFWTAVDAAWQMALFFLVRHIWRSHKLDLKRNDEVAPRPPPTFHWVVAAACIYYATKGYFSL